MVFAQQMIYHVHRDSYHVRTEMRQSLGKYGKKQHPEGVVGACSTPHHFL